MSVADKKYFSQEHVEQFRFNASSTLAEEAIHCLELVAQLTSSGLKFQFKGGNSLLLIFDQPYRFSIDVDIATDAPREEIEKHLDSIVQDGAIFIKWEKRQHKTKPWLPLASYHLFYNSHFHSDPVSIMLDAQLRRSPYRTELKQVRCGDIYMSSEKAEVPLPSSIIGDKLLTLGPSTLGIPVGKGKEAQRLKHVFDVSMLLRTNPRLSDVRESILACLDHENQLQNRVVSIEEIVSDTVEFCRTVTHHHTLPELTTDFAPVLQENIRGLEPFAQHLFKPGYDWSGLQIDTSRVAFCMEALLNESMEDSVFSDLLLKKNPPAASARAGSLQVNPEALYFWSIVESWHK